ncbi:MAG: glycoside hydrolase [Actinomycetota bacterium]|nr:glycoside hydrolase [Actinomycetota bacterium]
MNGVLRRAALVLALGAVTAASSLSANAQTTTAPTTTTTQATPGQTTPGGELVPGSQASPGRQTTPGGQTTPDSETAAGGDTDPAFQAIPSFPKAQFAAQDVEVQRLTDGVHMTKEDTAPTRGFTGPTSMAVHPENPRVIAAATANLRTRLCYLLVSTDAGATWRFSEERPERASYPSCTNNTAAVPQPSLAWGRDGTLYYASQAYGEGEGVREGKTSIVLARTTDLGKTWTTTMVNDARAQPDPKPENTGVTGLAVDTSGDQDVVYVGYSRDWSATAPEGHPLAEQGHVAVSVSTDGGDSFGEPINLNDHSKLTTTIGGQPYPLHFQTAFGRPFLTAHDGVVLAVGDSGPPADNEPPEDVYDGIFSESDPMLVARSTDQGRTWTVSELSKPVYTAAGSYTGMGWTPNGGPDGTFVFAYSATPGDTPSASRSDIVLQRSTDMGLTWTDPVAINDDDPSNQYSSFYPNLDVAPNGRVDVIWQDNRGLADYLVDVRYTYSTDGGETWAPSTVVTDEPINFNFGISFNSDIRQPPGVASTNAYAAIAWADPRFADEQTQTQDNFGVFAQFSDVPSGVDTTWRTLAAILGGLVLAGIVLLLVQSVRKRA